MKILKQLLKSLKVCGSRFLNSLTNDQIATLPLLGKHTSNFEEDPFDLTEKITNFLAFNEASPKDPKVMLLMGNIESGQSLFSSQLLFSLEHQTIQFLADRIEMNETCKQKMIAMIKASKNNHRCAIGAANACRIYSGRKPGIERISSTRNYSRTTQRG